MSQIQNAQEAEDQWKSRGHQKEEHAHGQTRDGQGDVSFRIDQ